jgi:hypothetical protein
MTAEKMSNVAIAFSNIALFIVAKAVSLALA